MEGAIKYNKSIMIFGAKTNLLGLVSRTGRSILRRLASSQVWYRDDSEQCLHEPHHTDPPQCLSPQQLCQKTGVALTKVEKSEDKATVDQIMKQFGFNYFDVMEISRKALPDFEEKMRNFYKEHLHTDLEVRLIHDGSGFFEVRDVDDRWIRLHVARGDLVNLPAGLYHRLTLDACEYIKMYRMFTDSPDWTALFRPEGECHPVRVAYLQNLRCANKA